MRRKFWDVLTRVKNSSGTLEYLYNGVYKSYRGLWHVTPHQFLHRSLGNRYGLLLYLSNLKNRTVLKKHADVMARDWDNLIVLDSCRFDLFEQTNTMDGTLEEIISPGSGTGEFFRYLLKDRDLTDTVFVATSPAAKHVSEQVSVRLFKLINVWQDEWDDELNTVHPKDMVEAVVDANETYPNKRIVAHFMQPHYPFIGETGQSMEQGSFATGYRDTEDEPSANVWRRLEDGDIDHETFWMAYRENLEIVLPHVEELVERIDGRSVVTSDHGNSFGRKGIYGHKSGMYLDGMIQVPWFVASKGPRREIAKGEPHEMDAVDSRSVNERLEDLGYVDGEEAF